MVDESYTQSQDAIYTVSQAANFLVVREDSVTAFLQVLSVDLGERSPAMITQTEMDMLIKIVRAVKKHWIEFNY